MKKEKIDVCPACGAELQAGVCKQCGYVRILFPEGMPESLRRMEQERLEATKGLLAREAELRRALAACEERNGALCRELELLRAQLAERPAAEPLKGVVMLEDIRHGIRTMLPVYEGVNGFGLDPDRAGHRQIKFRIRGYAFRPEHFWVTCSEKGLVLEVADGVELTQEGRPISGRVYARQSDNFLLDGRVRLNVTDV